MPDRSGVRKLSSKGVSDRAPELVARLTPGTTASQPTWSPDGTRIAFMSAGGIYTMTAAGTGISFITQGYDPAWQPLS